MKAARNPYQSVGVNWCDWRCPVEGEVVAEIDPAVNMIDPYTAGSTRTRVPPGQSPPDAFAGTTGAPTPSGTGAVVPTGVVQSPPKTSQTSFSQRKHGGTVEARL